MGVFRVKKDNNFVVMDKTSLRDDRLSWKAKGLHAYMLSLPDDWTFHDSELEKHAKDGKDSLKSAIKELKLYGYLIREQKRGAHGRFEYETTVVEKPLPEKPLTENPQLLSNDVLEEEERATAFFENNGFGTISSYMAERINDWVDQITNDVVIYAMKIAVENNVRKWKYVNNILVDWHSKGVKSLQDAENLVREFESNKSTKGKGQIDWEGL